MSNVDNNQAGKTAGGWQRYRQMLSSRIGLATAGCATALSLALGGTNLWDKWFRPLTAHDLSGKWCVTDVVKNARHARYVGMTLMFEFVIEHDGNRVRGTGRKTLVNGTPPPALEISVIEITHGTLRGESVVLQFIERNDARPERKSLAGTFSWKITDENTLRGIFSSAAAGSDGTSEAKRC